MKNSKTTRLLSLLLAACVCFAMLAGCSTSTPEVSPADSDSGANEVNTTPLVVGYSNFSEKFSVFFADSAYDMDICRLVNGLFLTTDRVGGTIYNSIEGETVSYNGVDYIYNGMTDVEVAIDDAAGITTYTIKIKEGILFSDGVEMTADDLIFSYYVTADPTYDGSSTLYSMPIQGMSNYRTQTSDEVYKKYDAMFSLMSEYGFNGEYEQNGDYDAEMYDAFNEIMAEEWTKDVQAIADYVAAEYMGYAADMGFDEAEIMSDEGVKAAFAMTMWGFGEYDPDAGEFTSYTTGNTWTLKDGDCPTIEDFTMDTMIAYENDPDEYWGVEAADETPVTDAARAAFIYKIGSKDESLGGQGIPNISGVKKLDKYTVQVTTDGFDAAAIYQIVPELIGPLHYYGDLAQYDYENNKFGFPVGDLSIVKAKTNTPLGAGPYKFVKYENKVVYFEANENYYKGEPKIKYLQFKETIDADGIPGVATGTIDIANPSGSVTKFDEIKSYNSNGELSGDKIVTSTVDNLGYGYLGINADNVKVGDDPGSEESRCLRSALATIISVYRDVGIDTYYGEVASVINYPISNTSWAAPQKTDEGYSVCYSTDIDGKDLYTEGMTSEEKYEAAKQAAIGFLKKAGYTFDEASGKFTAAPEGAKLEYQLIIPADGIGDHPSYGIVTNATEALKSIGITLTIYDPTNSSELWDIIDVGDQELWCAAWQATIDPDMYQVYHSSNIVGKGGTDSNHYAIADSELDELIIKARASADQTYRKATYKACLDIILDWVVEIPVYQRQNCIIFTPERIDMDTVTPDITTFYEWWYEIENMQMK